MIGLQNITVNAINTYYVYCKSAVLRFSSCSIISDLFQTVSLIRFPLLKDIYKKVNIPFSYPDIWLISNMRSVKSPMLNL